MFLLIRLWWRLYRLRAKRNKAHLWYQRAKAVDDVLGVAHSEPRSFASHSVPEVVRSEREYVDACEEVLRMEHLFDDYRSVKARLAAGLQHEPPRHMRIKAPPPGLPKR